MARRRARSKRFSRKRRSSRTRKGRSSTWGAVAVRGLGGLALKVLKKKLGLNTEVHYQDTIDVAAALTTTFTTFQTSLLTIAVGDSVSTRTGRSIRISSIHIRGSLRAVAAATDACRVRIICFYQPYCTTAGAFLTPADVLEDNTAALDTPYDMNATGYRILMDQTFVVSPYGQDGSIKQWSFHYTPLSHHVEWTSADTTGAANNLLRGFIRFCAATDAVSTHEPTNESYARIKWVDN